MTYTHDLAGKMFLFNCEYVPTFHFTDSKMQKLQTDNGIKGSGMEGEKA